MDFSKFVSESNPFSCKKLVQKRLIVSIKPKEPGLFDQLIKYLPRGGNHPFWATYSEATF